MCRLVVRSTCKALSLGAGPLEVGVVKETIFGAKGDKVGKERVKVALTTEMEQILELGVVDVSKDAEELFVDVFARGEKGGREIATGFGGEGGFVREQATDPGHDVVNVPVSYTHLTLPTIYSV